MTPNVVWGTGNLVTNMIAILERRLVEATIRGLQDKPFAGAVHARLDDVAAFLSGGFDDSRCAALLAGLIWVHSTHPRMDTKAPASPVPFAYAALKTHLCSRRGFASNRSPHRDCAVAGAAGVGPAATCRRQPSGRTCVGRRCPHRHGASSRIGHSIPVRPRTIGRASGSCRTQPLWSGSSLGPSGCCPPHPDWRPCIEDPGESRLSGRHCRAQHRAYGGNNRCRLTSPP